MVEVAGVSGTTINIVCWLSVGIAFLTIVARLISRICITKFFGIDDVFIIISFLVLVVLNTLASLAVQAGYGSHFKDLSDEQKVRAGRWLLTMRCFSPWPLAVPKLSVVALLIRVFEPSKIVKRTFYAIAASGLLVAALATILWIVQCSPVEKQYNPSITEGHCWPRTTVYQFSEFQFGQSVVYDFIFALYPMTVLFKLQMSLPRKIGISINMALGVLAGLAGIIKLAMIRSVGKQGPLDPTYVEPQVTIEIAIEAALLIVAACIPTSGPVLSRLKVMLFGGHGWSYDGRSGRRYQRNNHNNALENRSTKRRHGDSSLEDGVPMKAHAAPPSKRDASIELDERMGGRRPNELGYKSSTTVSSRSWG